MTEARCLCHEVRFVVDGRSRPARIPYCPVHPLSDAERLADIRDYTREYANNLYLDDTRFLLKQLDMERSTCEEKINAIEVELQAWIVDLISEGGARKVRPFEDLLAFVKNLKETP